MKYIPVSMISHPEILKTAPFIKHYETRPHIFYGHSSRHKKSSYADQHILIRFSPYA